MKDWELMEVLKAKNLPLIAHLHVHVFLQLKKKSLTRVFLHFSLKLISVLTFLNT